MTNKYYATVDKLTHSIQDFWKKIQSDTLQVYDSYVESVKVANKIAKIYTVFEEIEHENKRIDYRIYYVFALIQRFLLNDLAAHDLYLHKMNSYRDLNRLASVKQEERGFILVHGSLRYFGQILLSNQVFRNNLGYNQADLKHEHVQVFMPALVKQWHTGFVNEFNRTGVCKLVDRERVMFLRKRDGYVVPARMGVRFHYSKDYEFTFVMFVSFLKEVDLEKNGQKHKVDQVLFLLCDPSDTRITDISPSCSQHLPGLTPSLLHSPDFPLTLDSLCPRLSFRKLHNQKMVLDLDMNAIEQLQSKTKTSRLEKAVCSVSREEYGRNRDKHMLVAAITMLDKQ